MRNALRVPAYRAIDEKFSSLMDFCVGGRSSSSDPSGANYFCFGYCKIFISWKTNCVPLAMLFIRRDRVSWKINFFLWKFGIFRTSGGNSESFLRRLIKSGQLPHRFMGSILWKLYLTKKETSRSIYFLCSHLITALKIKNGYICKFFLRKLFFKLQNVKRNYKILPPSWLILYKIIVF